VKKELKILIVDRSRRVREFMKRELEKDFHSVHLADSHSELIEKLKVIKDFNLLILDPDLPDAADTADAIMTVVSEKVPSTPVIIHTYLSEFHSVPKMKSIIAKIEKNGNSIDNIRKTISEYLVQHT
jgi:CheY-like chemotaxis protein